MLRGRFRVYKWRINERLYESNMLRSKKAKLDYFVWKD
jgi:hypothetical protein